MDDRSKRLLVPVLDALKGRQDIEAVRRLVDAVSHESPLRHANLAVVLPQAIGKAGTTRLLRAFAQYPCPGCKQGLLVCDLCDGRGHFAGRRVCDICTGLGATNCDFCGGSRWITYNFVPESLRAAVLLERVRRVAAECEVHLGRGAPDPRGQPVAEARRELARELVQVNRLLGAFNNAVELVDRLPGARRVEPLKRIRTISLRGAAKLERRVRAVLLHLAKVEASAANVVGSPTRVLAARRSRFYQELARSPDFTGTSLYHLYLREVHASPDRAPAGSA